MEGPAWFCSLFLLGNGLSCTVDTILNGAALMNMWRGRSIAFEVLGSPRLYILQNLNLMPHVALDKSICGDVPARRI